MNKELKIIGWTQFKNAYSDKFSTQYTDEHENVLIQYLRKKGIIFDGMYHQSASDGVPVFSDDVVMTCSMREWGHIIALSVGEEDEMAYTTYAWIYDKRITPSELGERIIS